jgi:hypothetical protein
MTARDLEHMHATVTGSDSRLRERVVVTFSSALAAGFAATFSLHLAIAFAVATVAAVAMTLVARQERIEHIARLALYPDAYSIPEVAAYGGRCARKRERERLAKRIRDLIADPHPSQSLHLADRVARYAHELDRIATEIAVAARVRPHAVVACRRLLTHAAESPLYNPGLPIEDLGVALDRIRRGLSRG